MKNQEIAKMFYEIADYLEMDKVAFKPFAYRKAAESIEGLQKDIDEIYKQGGIKALMEIAGVGQALALKIEEYLKTGKLKYYQGLKKKTPVKMEELVAVEGLGPRKVKTLYDKLKVKNLHELEKAAKTHKIEHLFGFGEKTEKNILQGIDFLKRGSGRFLLGDILPKAEEIVEKLKSLPEVEKISLAGSVKRMKETIGDVDILVVSKNHEKVMDYFVRLPGVVKVWGKGTTKSSVRLSQGFDVDIRVIPAVSYGAALQYFTGSKEHNIALRKIAIDKGYKLNEYGLFKGKKMIPTPSEEDIYRILGLVVMPAEIREDRGEIEASKQGKLPNLIEEEDIKGDLHCHSDWDGGENSIEELATASQKMGYEYVGIADHTKFLKIEQGLDEKQLIKRNLEIDKLNAKLQTSHIKLRILKGCEANIMADGSIDIKDEVLRKMDFVIAGVHSQFKMTQSEMTKRIITAMNNPHVDIISHPTGRIILKRDEYKIDFDQILVTACKTGTILEINSYPERLDLSDINIKKAKEAGVKMVINTDSHQKDQLPLIRFGVAQGRRGWAEKKDIINTQTLSELMKYFLV